MILRPRWGVVCLSLVLLGSSAWGKGGKPGKPAAEAAAPPAKPQGPTPEEREQAQLHFTRGEKLFAIGEFADALDEYRAAYEIFPAPELLFNIGQCHRNLGNYDEAIFSFSRYLELKPDAANRPAVEAVIKELEQKKKERDSHKLVPTTQPDGGQHKPPPPPPDKPFYKTWWFWTTVSVVVVGGAAGGYYLYSTRDQGGLPETDFGNFPFPPQ